MADLKVQSFPVVVYKDNTLATWAGGCIRYIDCNFSYVKNESISLTVGGNKCVNYQPGDSWPGGAAPEGVDLTATVKIAVKNGFLWINQASYDSLLNACNACCVAR